VDAVYIGLGTSGDHTLLFITHSWFQDRKGDGNEDGKGILVVGEEG